MIINLIPVLRDIRTLQGKIKEASKDVVEAAKNGGGDKLKRCCEKKEAKH